MCNKSNFNTFLGKNFHFSYYQIIILNSYNIERKTKLSSSKTRFSEARSSPDQRLTLRIISNSG